MAEITDSVREWLAAQHRAVLITLRADGSPQSSNVTTAFDGTRFHVSVTDDRAKTRNLARDPRAVMHVLGTDFWSYASVPCVAQLGPVSARAGDQAGQDLLALYNAIRDTPHPNPAEFFDAMVREHRLRLSLRAQSVSGMGWNV
jgi:PPOX class probable F420-dependent enzyme